MDDVCDIVQEAGSKTIPMEKKCEKGKWLSEEALQIAVKRSKEKEKERYTHLNAEFQRIARRDKKPFLSDQCKEIEENNRMGKTRDVLKKIRDSKGTFHAKMGWQSPFELLGGSRHSSAVDAGALDLVWCRCPNLRIPLQCRHGS